ncbi:MAG: DUF4296 domain-containing protein [Flavobacteriales bacterium]
MNKLFKYAICFMLFFACSDAQVQAPANLIEQNKFVEVLVDVRLLEGSYSAKVQRPDTIRSKMTGYYQTLFDKHGISKEQFVSSYNYYLQRNAEMIGMEDSVMMRLQSMSKSLPSDTISTAGKDSTSAFHTR